MVRLEIAKSANIALAEGQPLTAIFPGGTSGIGEFAIRTLASHYGKTEHSLRVYIIGRNQEAANKIISDCSKKCPHGEFRFVKAQDLSLLRDVDRCCDELMKLEDEGATKRRARIDLMVLSHADLHLGGRRDTVEGLDKSMSLLYYSRMHFITKLLPLLRASNLPAHVISVYAAGVEKTADWNPNDLSLRQPGHYGFVANRAHNVIAATLFMERIVEQNAGKLSFTHVFPSLVITPAFNDRSLPLWFKAVWFLLGPIAGLFAVSAEEIGERILFFASARYPARDTSDSKTTVDIANQNVAVAMSTDDVRGGGAYSCKYDGETCKIDPGYKKLREQSAGDTIREHTMAAFNAIEAGEVFND